MRKCRQQGDGNCRRSVRWAQAHSTLLLSIASSAPEVVQHITIVRKRNAKARPSAYPSDGSAIPAALPPIFSCCSSSARSKRDEGSCRLRRRDPDEGHAGLDRARKCRVRDACSPKLWGGISKLRPSDPAPTITNNDENRLAVLMCGRCVMMRAHARNSRQKVHGSWVMMHHQKGV